MAISTPHPATNGAPRTSVGAFEGLPQHVQDFVRKPGRLLIDGEWVEAASGKTFETLNPATEESLGRVALGAPEDIELAVAAARRCFDDERSDWRRMTPSERGKVIHRIGDLIARHADELAALEAGLPAGVVNIVTGFGDAGAALAAHDGVDKVAFTGSTEVGRLIVQAAVGNLKKVTLELGGKSPQVLYKDADMDVAIPGAANGIFFNQGQCCNAGSRLYVERDVYDEVVQGISDEAKKIKVGPGLDPDTQMGPLISAEQHDKVLGYLSSGLDAGASAPAGGGRAGDRGYFVQPTVLTDTTPDMKVVREEIFGPVVCAIPFGSEDDDVIRSGNDTNFGLASGIWTRDINKAHRTANRLRAGTVWINCYSVFDAAMPFGGYKESGWGREMGHNALENYLETKSVVTQLA